MVDIVDGQGQLIVMFVRPAAELRTPVRQDAQDGKVIFLVEWQHPIIEQVSGTDRCLGRVKLGMGNLGIGVHIGLLIDTPNALQCADIEYVVL